MEEEKNYNDNYDAKFSDLVGKTITQIEGKLGDEQMRFHCESGEAYQMKYYPDCCATCTVEDICGELEDLVGSPILLAEEVSSKEPRPELAAIRAKEKAEAEAKDQYYYDHDSETWTFYKLATIKGSVTIRWYGSSNGYYSENVTFERVEA